MYNNIKNTKYIVYHTSRVILFAIGFEGITYYSRTLSMRMFPKRAICNRYPAFCTDHISVFSWLHAAILLVSINVTRNELQLVS